MNKITIITLVVLAALITLLFVLKTGKKEFGKVPKDAHALLPLSSNSMTYILKFSGITPNWSAIVFTD